MVVHLNKTQPMKNETINILFPIFSVINKYNNLF